MNSLRKSWILKFFWVVFAMYIFNISINTTDANFESGNFFKVHELKLDFLSGVYAFFINCNDTFLDNNEDNDNPTQLVEIIDIFHEIKHIEYSHIEFTPPDEKPNFYHSVDDFFYYAKIPLPPPELS